MTSSRMAPGDVPQTPTLDHPYVATALEELDCTYNVDGSVHTVSDRSDLAALAGNTATTTYTYDPLARVTSISQSGTGVSAKQTQYGYYDDSRVHTVTASAGAAQVYLATYGYDADGRLTSLAYTHNGAAITTGGNAVSYTASYDPAGNLVKMVSADGTDNYTLDNSNQLQSASLTSEGYSYDQNGNRTNSGYQTSADNRLLSDGVYDYQYDAEGNRTKRTLIADGSWVEYAWDYRNRLTQETFKDSSGDVTQVVAYVYDSFGRVVRRFDSNASPSYVYTVYDGRNAYRDVSDTTTLAGTGTPVISRRYLYGPAVDQILATDNCSGTAAGVLWGLGDNEGTIRDVVDSTGALQNHVQYDSFGKPLSALAANFLFGQAGMRYDAATGEYRTANRVYDPRIGRPLSQDPLGLLPDSNPYRWCNNNLAVNTDPSGLWITGASRAVSSIASSLLSSFDLGSMSVNWPLVAGQGLAAAVNGLAGGEYDNGSDGAINYITNTDEGLARRTVKYNGEDYTITSVNGKETVTLESQSGNVVSDVPYHDLISGPGGAKNFLSIRDFVNPPQPTLDLGVAIPVFTLAFEASSAAFRASNDAYLASLRAQIAVDKAIIDTVDVLLEVLDFAQSIDQEVSGWVSSAWQYVTAKPPQPSLPTTPFPRLDWPRSSPGGSQPESSEPHVPTVPPGLAPLVPEEGGLPGEVLEGTPDMARVLMMSQLRRQWMMAQEMHGEKSPQAEAARQRYFDAQRMPSMQAPKE